MIEMLVKLIGRVEPEEIDAAIALSLGKFGSDFDQKVLGIKDRFVLSALSKLNGIPESEIKQLYSTIGDVGDLAAQLSQQSGVQTRVDDFFSDSPVKKELTINLVYNNILKLSEPNLSNQAKVEIIGNLNSELSSIEKKFFFRNLVGKLRLGVKESTWINALAESTGVDKERFELAYYLNSDLSLVSKNAMSGGSNAVDKLCRIRVGVPIHSMLAQRITAGDQIRNWIDGSFVVETKYDGYRIQIHVDTNRNISLWSRGLESYTDQFPDVVEGIKLAIPKPMVADGEVVAYDPKSKQILNFSTLTQRSRKYDIEKIMKEVKVRVYLFDVLHYDGIDYINHPFLERRKVLESCISSNEIVVLSQASICDDVDEIDQRLFHAKELNQEGIMIKDISDTSFYEPGKRSFNWFKYKADYTADLSETFDLVVLGASMGKGKRAGTYGTLLMGSYDPLTEKYYSFCKMGSGLSDKDLEEMKPELDAIRVPEQPHDYICDIEPDIWVAPKIILEVSAAEISKSPVHTVKNPEGDRLALRFPRLIGRRDDKTVPDGITTVEEIISISTTLRIGS